jgi:acyl-CoA synthetase
MPEVAEAVVVAAPDERFGERVVAVVRIRPGHELPDRERVRAHFAAAGMARQKWPEELRMVDDYPRTASGKVQKYLVRQQVGSVSVGGEQK